MSALTLYTAMTGLEATSYRQDLQATNLANIDTVGFRAQIGVLRASPFVGPKSDAGQADVVTEDAGYSSKAGGVVRTGAPFDVALSGSGWLLTRTTNGTLALTRDGRLHIGADGSLRDSAGDAVLGANQQPINLPKLEHVQIGADGAISGVPVGQGSQQAQQFNRLFLAKTPSGVLTRLGASRFQVPAGASLKRATGTQVKQGYLEKSDVNAVAAMTQLIDDTRAFQIETKLVTSSQNASQGLDALISQG